MKRLHPLCMALVSIALASPLCAQIKPGAVPSFKTLKAPTSGRVVATLPAQRAQIFMKLTGATAAPPQTATRTLSPMHLVDTGAYIEFIGAWVAGSTGPELPDGSAYIMPGEEHAVRFYLPKSAKPAIADCSIGNNPHDIAYIVNGPDPEPARGLYLGSQGHFYIPIPPSPKDQVGVTLYNPKGDWVLYGCQITQMG